MFLHFKFTFLYFIKTVLVGQNCTAADDVAEPVSKLSRKLQQFQLEFNIKLATVVDTIRMKHQTSRLTTSAGKGHTNTAKVMSTLQNRIDKVGKLLHTVGDLIWDRVYFATSGGKIMVHSVEMGDTRAVVDKPFISSSDADGFRGVTYDSKDKKMYFSSTHAIYRANLDGSDIEMAFSSMTHGLISGLAFDSGTGNLYGVSYSGIVFACKARVSGLMQCTMLLEDQGNLRGIAVDTINGTLYWTAEGKIMKSNTDGSSSETLLLRGLKEPVGIVIGTPRDKRGVMWVDDATGQLWALALDGTNSNASIMAFPYGFKPRGLTLAKNNVIVGTSSSIHVISRSPDFKNPAYSSRNAINHLFTPS